MDKKQNKIIAEENTEKEELSSPKKIGLNIFLKNQKTYLIFAGIFLVGLPLLLTATLASTRLISRASYNAIVMTPITPPTPTISATPTPLVTPTCVPRPSCLDQRVPCRVKLTPGTVFCPKPTPTKAIPTKAIPTKTLPTRTLPTKIIPTQTLQQSR